MYKYVLANIRCAMWEWGTATKLLNSDSESGAFISSELYKFHLSVCHKHSDMYIQKT